MDELLPNCKFPECEMPIHNKTTSLCNGHYQQHYLKKPLKPLRSKNKGNLCLVDWCSKPAIGRGYCQGHYHQVKLGRELGELGRPIGVWKQDARGYLVRSNKNTIERQHRIIMEEYLGRKLLPGETVHHINGIRDDNRIENLELWSTSQPYGQRVSDKLAWAREIIELYGQNE